ncbi:hypothetical protein V4Y02_24080, partial [Escherichia coli]
NNPIHKWAKKMSRYFIEREIPMVNKYSKKCSAFFEVFVFLAIREMQTKTLLRFHLIPVRVAIMNNTSNNKCT